MDPSLAIASGSRTEREHWFSTVKDRAEYGLAHSDDYDRQDKFCRRQVAQMRSDALLACMMDARFSFESVITLPIDWAGMAMEMLASESGLLDENSIRPYPVPPYCFGYDNNAPYMPASSSLPTASPSTPRVQSPVSVAPSGFFSSSSSPVACTSSTSPVPNTPASSAHGTSSSLDDFGCPPTPPSAWAQQLQTDALDACTYTDLCPPPSKRSKFLSGSDYDPFVFLV